MAVNSVKKDENTALADKTKTILRLAKYLLNYKGTIFIVLLVIAVATAITLVNPLIMEYAVNVCIVNKDYEAIYRVVIIALILNLVLFGAVKARMYLMAKISNKILVTVRDELYTHLQKLGLKFYDSLPAGKILSRVIEDVNSLKGVLQDLVVTLLPQFITLSAVLVIMFIKNPILAAATLVSTPLLIAGLLYIKIKCSELWHTHSKKSSNLSGVIHEDISGMRIIQGFAAESETESAFDTAEKEHWESFRDAVKIGDLFNSIIEFTTMLSTVCMYYVAVKVLGITSASVGTLIAFATYAGMIWHPISQLGNLYTNLVRNVARANRIFEVIDTEPEVFDREGATELPEISGQVEFKNVSFSYDDKKGVLDNVSFTVKPGETIALVGPTGAGKSTIANLISRFYDIKQGQILIDGHDLTSVTVESLRKQMGVMTQDNFLFTGTIAENIRYGKLDATQEEIEAAAKAVNAHEFIMKLEKGYETELQERGAGLSVGQRQLLAFARTMVSMPKILILDEATSSIDTQNEILVQKGIAQLLKGRTSFVIAHRLSTIKNADRIFVVDHGRIVEAGSHNELMEKKGEYYNLCMAQAV
ncbi:MAG: ABC transporter ATP-binding protein/permease [Lachnospiraceae bacterium]|nr:ABC transporter ATP-binding protein/permease [Lachnospiraceae bacterium]